LLPSSLFFFSFSCPVAEAFCFFDADSEYTGLCPSSNPLVPCTAVGPLSSSPRRRPSRVFFRCTAFFFLLFTILSLLRGLFQVGRMSSFWIFPCFEDAAAWDCPMVCSVVFPPFFLVPLLIFTSVSKPVYTCILRWVCPDATRQTPPVPGLHPNHARPTLATSLLFLACFFFLPAVILISPVLVLGSPADNSNGCQPLVQFCMPLVLYASPSSLPL